MQNDGNGFFTHVTRKSDSPNPPYNVNDSTTWPLGLVQDATDGDYGSATDYNDDGWVDIVVRKRNQVDLFENNGGTFQNGVDIDDANNGNKGAVAFGDLDNDGDFDLYWTENGTNQIHQNNGDGTWTGLGAATGIPTSFPGQIEGLAFGDVDNDGDLDIFLANGGNGGSHNGRLYLNQVNNGGGAMSFVDSGLTFANRGEGCTFVDIDNDGDLDLYLNRSGNNVLYINNLGTTARTNHVYVNIIEDRDDFGLINSEERFGIGATVKIIDCDGYVISGTREVNGGYGHGTQGPGIIHFGLPGGPNTPIVLEISYPRTTSGRVIVRSQVTPSDFFNGNVNLVDVLPDVSNLPPVAQDDNITTTEGASVTFNALVDNGNGIDIDPEGGSVQVISISQPADGTAVLNPDGTISYNPGSFVGTTSFTYTIGDNAICSFASAQDTATINITILADTDLDSIPDIQDLDDDNDGIIDVIECEVGFSSSFASSNGVDVNQTLSSGAGHLQIDFYTLDNSFNIELNGLDLAGEFQFQPGASGNFARFSDGFTYGQNGVQQVWQMTGTSDNPIIRLTIDKFGNVQLYGARASGGPLFPLFLDTPSVIANWNGGSNNSLIIGQSLTGPTNMTGFTWFSPDCDIDSDLSINSADIDSDGDGCNDVLEVGFTDGDNDGILGSSPVIVDVNGQVISATDGYTNPLDADSNGTFDFIELGTLPTITSQPVDTTTCPGCSTNLTVVSDGDSFQWQLFDGSSWVNLSDLGIYTGSSTATLTITNPTRQENNNEYRVVISNESFVCGDSTSNPVALTIQVNTIITNRRITYRVNRN